MISLFSIYFILSVFFISSCLIIPFLYFYYKRNKPSFFTLFFVFAMAELFIFFIVFCAIEVFLSPQDEWNHVRMVVPFALRQGLSIYPDTYSGVIMPGIYGPVRYIVNVIFTFLPDVRSSIQAAILGNVLFFLIPPLIVALEVNKNMRSHLTAFFMFICFCVLSVSNPSLSYVLFNLHVDALAFCLAFCSIFYFYKAYSSRPSVLFLILAGILSTLAIFTKQTMLLVVVVVVAYDLLFQKCKLSRTYLFSMTLSAIFCCFLIAIFMPFQDFCFKVFVLPGSSPWQSGKQEIGSYISALAAFGKYYSVAIISIIFCLFHRKFDQNVNANTRSFIGLDERFLFALAMVMLVGMIPSALRCGGGINTYATSGYFFLLTAMLMVARSVDVLLSSDSFRSRFSVIVVLIFLGLFVILTLRDPYIYKLRLLSQYYLKRPLQSDLLDAYVYAARNPGIVYFPSNPLILLLTEKKIYHFDEIVEERELAGYPPNKEQLQLHVPQKMQYIAFPSGHKRKTMLKYFPAFTEHVTLSELPNWIIYTSKDKEE